MTTQEIKALAEKLHVEFTKSALSSLESMDNDPHLSAKLKAEFLSHPGDFDYFCNFVNYALEHHLF